MQICTSPPLNNIVYGRKMLSHGSFYKNRTVHILEPLDAPPKVLKSTPLTCIKYHEISPAAIRFLATTFVMADCNASVTILVEDNKRPFNLDER